MADTQNIDLDAAEAAVIAEMKRRGMAVPEDKGASAPAAPAQVTPDAVTYDAMGNVTSTAAGTGEGGPAGDLLARGVKDVVRGVAVEGFGAITRGVSLAVKETGDVVNESIAGTREWANDQGGGTVGKKPRDMNPVAEIGSLGMQWIGERVAGLFDKRETVTGSLIEGVSQFAAGMIGASKFIKPIQVGGKLTSTIATGMARGAVVDATVFDGTDQRLSNLIEEVPSLKNPVTSFLAADPKDSQALGRFKNAVEGLIVGPAFDLLVATLSARRAIAHGDVATAKVEAERAEVILREMQGWHGSPHEFDRMEYRPRTGEGSEAFGAGGYIAESQGVAKHYRDIGMSNPRDEVAKSVEAGGSAEHLSDRTIRMLEDDERLNDLMDVAIAKRGTPEGEAALKELQAALPEGSTTGFLYEVKVRHAPEDLMEWEAKFSAQPEAVRSKIEAVAKENGIEIGMDPKKKADLEAELERVSKEFDAAAKEAGIDGAGWAKDPELAARLDDLNATRQAIRAELQFADPTGEQIYKALSQTLGSDEAASAALKEAGVPGHRFLDANSRNLPEGDPTPRTRNTVVYDPENSVEVVARDSKPVRAGEKAADEGLGAAPYSTDLKEPVTAAPKTPNAVMVLHSVSPEDVAKTQAALQAKWSVAGKAMVEEGQDFNFRHITDDEDMKAAVNAISAANADKFREMKGGNLDGVETHREVLKLRDEIADLARADPDRVILALGEDSKAMERMAGKFLAYKQLMEKFTNDAADMANAALAHPEGSPERAKAAAEAFHATQLAISVQGMVKGMQTNTARTLGAMKLANTKNLLDAKIPSYTDLANKMMAGGYGAGDTDLLTRLAALKGNPKGVAKLAEMTFGGRLKGAFEEWYMNALLSGPKTHVANFIGNVMMTGYMPLERAVQGMMWGSGLSTKDVLIRMKDEYDGLGMALFDGFRAAGTALKQNASIMDPHNSGKMEAPSGPTGGLSSRAWGLTKDIYDSNGKIVETQHTPILSGMMDGLQTLVGIPSRLLVGSDELFKQVNYRSFLYVDAAKNARAAGLKPGTDEFANFVAQEMNRGFDSNGVAAAISNDKGVRDAYGAQSREGLQQAREVTFTQDLEYGIGRWLQGMANDSPAVRLIVPFVRTPTNIFRFALRHSPLAPIEYGFWRDIRAGGEPARKVAAQLTTGISIFAAATWLANNDVITGGFSPNPEVRKVQEMNGAKEYSIKIGDEYVQYNRLDPHATILGLAADFAKLTTHLTEAEADKLAAAMTVTLARNLASKTYVQGVMNMMNAVGDVMSGRSTTGLDTWLYKTAQSVAVPSIVNTFKDDESLREVRNMMDAFKARLPGYSKEVPAVRNILGEVVDAPQGWLLGPASPLGYSRNKKDVVAEELGKLMEATGQPLARIMPQLGETKIDLREVTLRTGQNAYDRAQQLMAETGVREALRELVTSEDYKSAEIGSLDYPGAKGGKLWLINRVLQQHRDMARSALLEENPDLMEMYDAERQRSKTEGFLGPQPRTYQPPKVLQSILGTGKNDLRKQ